MTGFRILRNALFTVALTGACLGATMQPSGGATPSSASEQAGQSATIGRTASQPAPNPRIHNGKAAKRSQTKWFVSWFPGDGGHCGGMIIAKRWILTAAHCVLAASGNARVQVQVNPKVRKFGAPGGYRVDRMIAHPRFVPGYDLPYDVGLMHVTRNLPKARIALNKSKVSPQINAQETVYGFGSTNPQDYDGSKYLRVGSLVDLSGPKGKTCGAYPRARFKSSIQICAGKPATRTDACGGDSGGPLVSTIKGKKVLVGVVSSGGDICNGDPKAPGIYTRVSAFYTWIQRAMSGAHLVASAKACPLPDRICNLKKGQKITFVLKNKGSGTANWKFSTPKVSKVSLSKRSGTLKANKSTTVTLSTSVSASACQVIKVSGTHMLTQDFGVRINGDEGSC